jgi:transcriptional regulator with XRE-family HTH domain
MAAFDPVIHDMHADPVPLANFIDAKRSRWARWARDAILGERIRELRKRKGYTLDELAARSESSKSYIWELENKDPPRPSGEKLALIAEALGVTPDYLLGVEPEVERAEDKAFFRKYQKMDAPRKAQIREMLEIINRKK